MTITMLNGPFGCAACDKEAAAIDLRRREGYGLSLGSYGKQIDWNTQPVVNDYPWNRDGFWDCSDWMTWHKKVAAKYGVARANEVFLIWWNKQGATAYADQYCMYLNKSFRDYMKSVGLNLDAIANYVTAPIDLVYNTQQTATDAAGHVVDAAGNVIKDTSDAASRTTGVLKTLIPVGVGLAAIGIGYYVYKNYLKGNRKVKVGPATV